MPQMTLADELAWSVSKLRYFSVGIVAQNKILGSDLIEVTPVEETPFLDGEISATQTPVTATGTDASGTTTTTTVTTSASIKATWLPFCASNRLTSPDVRRGEHVMIYQYGDADQYFWTTLKNDHKLRRLETVIYAFSGNSNNDAENDSSNMYFMEISTHRKVIHFHTSKANGEPYSYDIQLDTGNGKLVITDDIGNYFMLDSAAHRLYMRNVDGSSTDINRENITNIAPKTIENQCTDFIVKASNSTMIDAKNKFGVTTTASDIEASSTATMKSSTTTVTGSTSLVATGAGAGINAASGSANIQAPGSLTISSSNTSVI